MDAIAAMSNTDGGLVLGGVDEAANDPLIDIDVRQVDSIVAQLRSLLPDEADMVSLLLDAGAPDGVVEGRAPLHLAAYEGTTEIAALLVEAAEQLLAAGSDPNLACDDTYTSIMLSAATGERAMVELLLRHGADPTPQVNPAPPIPAEVARAAGHNDLAELLIAADS